MKRIPILVAFAGVALAAFASPESGAPEYGCGPDAMRGYDMMGGYGMGVGRGMMDGHGMMSGYPGDLDRVRLTAEQRDKIDGIQRDLHRKQGKLMRSMHELGSQLY